MSADLDLLQEADANQARASDPAASAWVSANAGTGKTAVLVKRVLRLLLAGSRPESILCLTYTKTAAAEMQNRLFKELADWAVQSDGDLRETLSRLMRRTPTGDEVTAARRLFAKALEARGGLKIHTIHGFCERLLQRFPLEAAVTPHFSVLDEQAAEAFKRDGFDTVLAQAASQPDSHLGQALTRIVALTSEDYFRSVVNAVLSKRAELRRIAATHGSAPDWPAAEAEALRKFLGVAGKDEASLVATQAATPANDQIDRALAALSDYGSTAKTDREAEATLRGARTASGGSRVAALRGFFLTQTGQPRARLCTNGFCDFAPDIAAMLNEAKGAFADLENGLGHLRLAEASGAVLVFADAIQTAYEQRKRNEAALDYDDLIARTEALLSRSNAAAWVLYKVDGGVDHILVDEAQDTNPEQWSIIEALAEEFLAGHGAHEQARTLFAVGDEKQSIYSFQGANPARFGIVGRAFRQRASASGAHWHEVPLNVSFRSTVPVLEAVDHVFAQNDAAQGLTFLNGAIIKHHAFRQGQAGLFEMWEVETTEPPTPTEPFEPWSEDAGGADAIEQLAKRIAARIRNWLDSQTHLASQGRPIRAGDILILVRRRKPFTAPMIRALKRAKIPVAGADRMRLLDQLAVQDLIALADVLLLPEDDLALAVVLKSPLFGFGDDALFDLAHGRRGTLWSALKSRAREDPQFKEAVACLTEWLGQADTLPPYEFFASLLDGGSQSMRKRMLTRLGPEAAEAIDEFLDMALSFDRHATPSLQGFIDELRNGEIDVKRDMDQDRDEVRIMTVHGAKGLQAPIVILPDTCTVPRGQGPQIYTAPRQEQVAEEDCHVFWPPKGLSGLAGLADAKSAARRAEREEYRRLLYVAMTRACDHLYVCGWEGVRRRETDCWYDLVERGLRPHLVQEEGDDGRIVWRLSCPQEKTVDEVETTALVQELPPLPAWARRAPAFERVRTRLAPSRLALNVGAETTFGSEQTLLGPRALAEDMRFARGRLVHALLQYLPEVPSGDWERTAEGFVAARGAALPETLRREIVDETLAIVRDEHFAPLFGPGSMAEVPVVAHVADGADGFDLEGQIDRLALLDDGLLILDYKTNRPPPASEAEVAPAYIGQLAAYRLTLRKMFPGKAVRVALLWTDGPRLMEISSTLLDRAERDMLSRRAALTR